MMTKACIYIMFTFTLHSLSFGTPQPIHFSLVLKFADEIYGDSQQSCPIIQKKNKMRKILQEQKK